MITSGVGFADCRINGGALRAIPIDPQASTRRVQPRGGPTGMKKPSSKIREEIVQLQAQLKLAETREAERIGRVALKAGLGEIEIEESDLQSAFEELAGRFRGTGEKATGRKGGRSRKRDQRFGSEGRDWRGCGWRWRELSACVRPHPPKPADKTRARKSSSAA
ncbi:conjugal transfer protein TraC [Ancylobacter dichloromethanicus]